MAIEPGETNFWLGILRDHSLFILNSLGPTETDLTRSAYNFYGVFEEMLKRPGVVSGAEAAQATEELIAFKKEILNRLLSCRIIIHLLPSDLNQMINEAREFLRVLGLIPDLYKDPTALLLHLHRLWLPDAAGHSAMLQRALDPDEFRLVRQLNAFESTFNMLYIKSILKTQMHQKLEKDFPSVRRLYSDSREIVQEHVNLLMSLEKLIQGCNIENNTTALLPNHMIREEMYFLNQVSRILA